MLLFDKYVLEINYLFVFTMCTHFRCAWYKLSSSYISQQQLSEEYNGDKSAREREL